MLLKYTTKELDLLARLMRAEALGEGELGMLMVGNVIVNRTIADCLTFKNKDSYELAHKIQLLLSNPKECQRLGDNNFEYTNKYHNYYDIKKKLVAFFGELLN